MPVLVLSMMRFTWAVMLVLVVVFLWRRGRLIDSEAKHLVCQLVSWSLTSLFSTNMAISGTNLVCHKLAMGTTDQSSFQLLWSGSALFKFWDTLHIFGMVKATEILNKLIIKRCWLIDWAVIWCFTPHKNKSFWPITRCTFWLGLYLSLQLGLYLSLTTLFFFDIDTTGIFWKRMCSPFPLNRHHRCNGECLEGKRENYRVCSVQYCVQQLYSVNCTHIWTDLTVLWIGFCLTVPISLCLDSFLCMYYFVSDCTLHACVVL